MALWTIHFFMLLRSIPVQSFTRITRDRGIPGGNGLNQDVMVHAGEVSMQRWLGGAAGLAEAGSAGMAVLDRNWHCRWGELDLVLERQQQLLVVEVKGRRTGCRDRHCLDAFYPVKRRRIARAINC